MYKQRAQLWNLIFAVTRRGHEVYFKGRHYGPDIDKLFVMGAVVSTSAIGKPTTASKIAFFLDMPRETARRKLDELVKIGLLQRRGNFYTQLAPINPEGVKFSVDLVKRIASAMD